MEVVASVVIDARINETLELHNEDGAGREASVGLGLAGRSCPSLYSPAMVGIEDNWTRAAMFCWERVGKVQFIVMNKTSQCVGVLSDPTSDASRPVPPCRRITTYSQPWGGKFEPFSIFIALFLVILQLFYPIFQLCRSISVDYKTPFSAYLALAFWQSKLSGIEPWAIKWINDPASHAPLT